MTKQPRVVLTLQSRIQQAINLGESHFREFKSAYEQQPDAVRRRDAKTIAKDVAETLVAFANADGGELLVGVEDNGDITGVPHLRDLLDTILRAPVTHVHQDTPLQNPIVQSLKLRNIPDSKILYFSVLRMIVKCLQQELY